MPVGPGYWRSSFWPFLVVISARFEAMLKPKSVKQKRSDNDVLEKFLAFDDRQRNIYLYRCFCFLTAVDDGVVVDEDDGGDALHLDPGSGP